MMTLKSILTGIFLVLMPPIGLMLLYRWVWEK